jgi:phosphoglycerate kinase
VDIGPLTVGDFHDAIKDAKTLLWNGPMGILEIPRYALGALQAAPDRALAVQRSA